MVLFLKTSERVIWLSNGELSLGISGVLIRMPIDSSLGLNSVLNAQKYAVWQDIRWLIPDEIWNIAQILKNDRYTHFKEIRESWIIQWWRILQLNFWMLKNVPFDKTVKDSSPNYIWNFDIMLKIAGYVLKNDNWPLHQGFISQWKLAKCWLDTLKMDCHL